MSISIEDLQANAKTEEGQRLLREAKERVRGLFGENKQIKDGAYDESLAVKCINGTFVGKNVDGVITHKGIPFVGEQPTGDLRWKAPVDYAACDGVFEAYYNGKSACQSEDHSEGASVYVQGEDCLYLNVWRADDGSDDLKPVMVWIHGGGYMMGGTVDPLYECHNLVAENPDVIAVSIAYRIGVFGFVHLSHLADGADYPDAQNLGIMDQIQALKWVHENIAGFGGDPDNVTIFGESAGGGSVSMLPLVKGSHKYFHRVIAQSGEPAITASTEESIGYTNEIMEVLGAKTVADLKEQSVENLLAAAMVAGLRIAPERDGKYLPVDAYEAYAAGAAKDIDLLRGCNKDEMDYFVFLMGPEVYEMWAADRRSKRIAGLPEEDRRLIESYRADVAGDQFEKDSRLFSQLWFNAPLIRTCESQASAGGRVFAYYFTPESSLPLLHCAHAMELMTVFNHPEIREMSGRAFDETFSKTLRRMWVKFATCGDPSLSADESPDGKAHEWPLYDTTNKQVMVLDEFDIHPAPATETGMVDWDRTYPMTKHYYL